MDFNIKSEYNEEKEIWKVKVDGEIDIYNSQGFKDTLHELLKERDLDVYIDCTDLEYIDSTGLGSLVAILKTVKQAEHNLHLTNVRSNVMKLFKITDLDKVFIIDEVI